MPNLSLLRTEAATTAAARKLAAAALFDQAGKIDVAETDEDADRVGRLLRRAKRLLADIDEERKGYTRLLDGAKSAIVAEYKPAIELLTDSESHLKGILDAQRRAQQIILDAEAEERMTALERAISDGDSQAVDAALEEQLASPARDKAYMPAGTSVTRHIKVEVTDKQQLADAIAAGILPLAVFEVNMTALRALGRIVGDTLPGVKVWYEEGVGASGR